MSLRNPVVLITLWSLALAASRIPLIFSKTRSVCWRISEPALWPVLGSSATCPDRYTKPFALLACEYGPMGLGPPSVFRGLFMGGSALRGGRAGRGFGRGRGKI